MQWFGETWGAPICDDEDHMETPTGELCPVCEKPINSKDQGVELPYLDEDSDVDYLDYHLDCFLEHIGLKPANGSN